MDSFFTRLVSLRASSSSFIERCKAANYHALCLTVDVPVGGNRERDLKTGMTMPPKFTLRSSLSFVTHPTWSLSQLAGPRFDLPNITDQRVGGAKGLGQPRCSSHRLYGRGCCGRV